MYIILNLCMFSKVFILIQMLFLIHVTQTPVRIMEHVTVCRVVQLVFVHQSIQDRHVCDICSIFKH